MKKILTLGVLLLAFFFVKSQSVEGVWKTIDDETGKAKSHVEIYKEGDKYFGKIVHIIDSEKRDANCTKCEDEKKDQPVLGMVIIERLVQDGDDYEDGTILDPNNGKVYDCKIWVDEKGDLQVRGYVGWFYRTQTWSRVK